MGAMTDDEITIINKDYNQIKTIRVSREEDSSGHLKAISAKLQNVHEIRCVNPYAEFPLSDEQIAVATVLDGMSAAILDGVPPAYTADEFATDIEIVQAFRYSAVANGRRIRLPLHEKVQKALTLTSLGYWKRKIS